MILCLNDYSWVEITLYEEAQLALLRKYLTVPNTQYFVNGRAPSYELLTLSQRRVLRFPQGLLSSVLSWSCKNNIKIEIKDNRKTKKDEILPGGAWLRDYQQDAVDKILEHKRGVIKIPTGGGKTEVACTLFQRIPIKWAFLSHRRHLLEQCKERMELRLGSSEGVHFGSLNSIWKQKKLLESFEGIVVDEVHVGAAHTYYTAVQRCKNAFYKIGLSGTPNDRTDEFGPKVFSVFGPIIYKLNSTDLINRGILAKPNLQLVDYLHSEPKKGTWQESYKHNIDKNQERSAYIASLVGLSDKPTMVFTDSISHGKEILRELRALGIASEHVSGSFSNNQRGEVLEDMKKGRVQALVASRVFDEGVDVPNISTVIIARGGKSPIQLIQRIGRGMRTDGGRKMSFTVIDIQDRGERYLERHAKERARIYKREGWK